MKKYIFYFSFLALAIWILTRFSVTQVHGNSMTPTYSDGDYLIVDLKKEPEDGDVVIIDTTTIDNWNHSSTQIIKRYYTEYSTDGLYVLGDNPEASYDSRYVGEIDKDCLVGVVVFSRRQ